MMPVDMSFRFDSNGGMSPAYTTIVLGAAGGSLDRSDAGKRVTARRFHVAAADLGALYALARRLEFTRISSTDGRGWFGIRRPVVYDAGSEGITLSWGSITHHVSRDDNRPFRRSADRVRYQELRRGILDLYALSAVLEGKAGSVGRLLRDMTALETVGDSGSREFDLFEDLRGDLAVEDWLVLSEHSGPAACLYAFWAVLKAKNGEFLNLLNGLSPRQDRIAFLSGGVRRQMPFRGVLLEILDREKTDFLSDPQKRYLEEQVERIRKAL